MKRFSLSNTAVIVILAAMSVISCKKIIHSGAPTPNNVRMVAYNKITTIEQSVPVPLPAAKVNESYRFYYDLSGRVSQIVYTGNDSTAFHLRSEFLYKLDTIIKTTSNVLTNSVLEIDTFVLNNDGQVVSAYFPGYKTTFEYFGKLLVRESTVANEYRHITMSAGRTYTSVNGDFLKSTADNQLQVNYTDLTNPLRIYYFTIDSSTYPLVDSMFYYSLSDMSQTIIPYNYRPLYLHVTDTLDTLDSLIYPGNVWANESYHFWTEDANRTGDYLQLESFTKYGVNIYQNSHLVESIAATNRNAYITYDKDSYNKILQTTVVTKDSVLNKYTTTYDIQYETF